MQELDLMLALGATQEGVNVSFNPDPGGTTPLPKNLIQLYRARGAELIAPGEYSEALKFCEEHDKLVAEHEKFNHMVLKQAAHEFEELYRHTGDEGASKKAREIREQLESQSYRKPKALAQDRLNRHFVSKCAPICIVVLERELEVLVSMVSENVKRLATECEQLGIPFKKPEGAAFRSLVLAAWLVYNQLKTTRRDCEPPISGGDPRSILQHAFELYELAHPAHSKRK